jgi:hypothetical protein
MRNKLSKRTSAKSVVDVTGCFNKFCLLWKQEELSKIDEEFWKVTFVLNKVRFLKSFVSEAT